MEKEDFNKLISEHIRRVRIEKGLTQSDVATLINMDAQNFSKYERGLISPTAYWVNEFCESIDEPPERFYIGMYSKKRT